MVPVAHRSYGRLGGGTEGRAAALDRQKIEEEERKESARERLTRQVATICEGGSEPVST